MRVRLRLAHQLSLLIGGVALLCALAIGGWSAWNLRAGFSEYLRARDAQQLAAFAAVVAQRVDWSSPREGLPMRELMDEFLHREGRAPPPDWRPPPPAGPEGRPRRGPPEGGPRRGPPAEAQRMQVVDTTGVRLGGPPFGDGQRWLEEPVRVNGQVVAYVRMLPSNELEEVDARFLRRQYGGLAAALCATLLLGVVLAFLAARRLSAPLAQLQAVTRRIADGELGAQAHEAGAREVAELIVDVNRMSAALQRLEGARRRWLAEISHELRTPLSVLRGELEALQDGVREPTPVLVATLHAEVVQLVRLVNDLHLLSLADLGALPREFGEVDVGALVRGVAARMAPRLQAAGLALEVDGDAPVRALWDAGRIEQLLANLLENSARYTTAPGRVRVAYALRGDRVRLVVEDSPPAVPAAQHAQLFEPLFRADTARRRRTDGEGGSGLGLSICRAIVQAHGGTITAGASALGGLRVEALLPLQPPHAMMPLRPNASTAP